MKIYRERLWDLIAGIGAGVLCVGLFAKAVTTFFKACQIEGGLEKSGDVILLVGGATFLAMMSAFVFLRAFLPGLVGHAVDRLFGFGKKLDLPVVIYGPIEAKIRQGKYLEAEADLLAILSDRPEEQRAEWMLCDLRVDKLDKAAEAARRIAGILSRVPEKWEDEAFRVEMLFRYAELCAKAGVPERAEIFLTHELQFVKTPVACRRIEARIAKLNLKNPI